MAAPNADVAERLRTLDRALIDQAHDLALFPVYDRPERANERPGLVRSFYAQRCLSDEQLNGIVEAFRSVGAYVELFAGEQRLIEALVSGRLQAIPRRTKIIYNGVDGGIGPEGFQPGRGALVPALADSYGIVCANSTAYGRALGENKFHYSLILRTLGIDTPRVWHYRLFDGWVGGRRPADGQRVIVKSTHEAWAVGVTENSVFIVDDASDSRVHSIANEIGQSVTVQEFVSGPEVYVPIVCIPDPVTTPPVEVILRRAPRDWNAVLTIDDNLDPAAVRYERYLASAEVATRLRENTIAVLETLQLESFARIDFRVDDSGTPWVTDVATSPGLGITSSAYRSFLELGLDHPTFLRVVVAATLVSRGLLRARTPPPAA